MDNRMALYGVPSLFILVSGCFGCYNKDEKLGYMEEHDGKF